MKNLLLIAYTFPPNEGIAGRRWSKLVKCLAKKGYKIHVIKAEELPGNKTSFWLDDVASKQISIHSIPRKYPLEFERPKKGFVGKLFYKYYNWRLNKKTKGTIYDLAFDWQTKMNTLSNQLISKHNIKTVIVTGAPFSVPYFTSCLKEKFHHLKVIVDYRDPYINAENYGMPDLNKARRSFEVAKHKYIIEHADYLMCPTRFMHEDLIKTSESVNLTAKLIELEHFYDLDDISPYLEESNLQKDKIQFIYGGAMYIGLDKYLKQLNIQLSKLKGKPYYSKLQIDFYVDELYMKKFFLENEDIVSFYPRTSDIYSKVSNSDFVMIMYGNHNKNYRTTKFMEFLPFRKPYIYIGPEGFVSKFINDNKLGFILRNNNLQTLIEEHIGNRITFNKEFDHTQFSAGRIADKLIGLIES